MCHETHGVGAGMADEWKPFQDPSRARVGMPAAELRDGEFAQTQQGFNRTAHRSAMLKEELRDTTQDAMCIGHDRFFKRPGWLLKENSVLSNELCIVRYVYEETHAVQNVTVYQSISGALGIAPDMSMNFISNGNHIRFMIPPDATYPRHRERRADHIAEIREIGRITRREALGSDPPGMSDTPQTGL